MEKILNEILNKLSGMESDVKDIKVNQLTMQSDITEIKEKVNLVYNQTATTCEDVTTLNGKFDDLKDDIDYLTHKENQTERDVYTIKKKLQVIK